MFLPIDFWQSQAKSSWDLVRKPKHESRSPIFIPYINADVPLFLMDPPDLCSTVFSNLLA